MTRRLTALLAAAAVALGVALGGPIGSVGSQSPDAMIAKSCKSDYKHAVIDGKHKCLRRGQYCKRSADKQYHKYGFHCHGERLT